MTSLYIFNIYYKYIQEYKKLYLIILFKINKYSKIDFYYIIFLFNLTIYFKIKNNRKLLFNIKKILH